MNIKEQILEVSFEQLWVEQAVRFFLSYLSRFSCDEGEEVLCNVRKSMKGINQNIKLTLVHTGWQSYRG